jgi:hypothetical protein
VPGGLKYMDGTDCITAYTWFLQRLDPNQLSSHENMNIRLTHKRIFLMNDKFLTYSARPLEESTNLNDFAEFGPCA